MAFYTKLTNIGLAKIASAIALGEQIQITEMALGDGNGAITTPTQSQTALVNEVYRGDLNQLIISETNDFHVVAELIVPTTEGGWTIREVGLYDIDGDLIAVGNFPETEKPEPADGTLRDMVVRTIIEVSNSSAITLIIDPYSVTATHAWVSSLYLLRSRVAGGTAGQILAKGSNSDEVFAWVDPTAAVNVTVDVIPENVTLIAAQTVVNFTTIIAQGIAVYIEGVRLILGVDYTVTGAAQITLTTSYPAGSILHAYQNDALDNIGGGDETTKGIVQFATDAQTEAGTATLLAVQPHGLRPYVKRIDSVSAIAAVVPTYTGQQFELLGYNTGWAATARGPIGGGTLYYDASDVTTADNGVTVFVTSGGHRLKRHKDVQITPEMGGCKGDGSSNDTDPFKRVISASKDIELQEATYLCSPTGTSGDFLLYLGTQGAGGNPSSRSGMRVHGKGDKSIIKLGNSVGRNILLFGGANGDTFDNMIFRDFVVDLNGQNNLQTSFADPLRYNSAFYFFCKCTNIAWERVTIKNLSGSQGIRVGNDTSVGYGKRIRLTDCHVENFGIGITGNSQQDVSAVYIQADDIVIRGGSFTNSDFTFDLSRGHTALELHGATRTLVTGVYFSHVQLPVLIASSSKNNRNVSVCNNTYEQCNYLGSLDPSTFDQKSVHFTGNHFKSTKTNSPIFLMGISGETAKTRDDIRVHDNTIDLSDNTNQATHFTVIEDTWVRSISLKNNRIKGTNGNLLYVAGQVKEDGYMEIITEGNEIDSPGKTSGSYPASPSVVHIETTSGVINHFSAQGDILLNSSAKNYSLFGAYYLKAPIKFAFVKGIVNGLGVDYIETTDLITSNIYKEIESGFQKPVRHKSKLMSIAATSSVNLFDFTSFTLNNFASFAVRLWVGVGGTANNSQFVYNVTVNSAAKTVTLASSNGTYSADILLEFNGNILRARSTSGTGLSAYCDIQGVTTKPIAWLV
jgi:hypothetical protein